MEDFPGNSHNKRTRAEPREPKKVERVVSGDIQRRKQPITKRFGGNARGVWGHVVLDVLVPAAKDMAADAITQGMERMLFGEARSSSRRTASRPGEYTAYNRFSPSSRPEGRREVSHRARARHDFDEIILATRLEAQDVLNALEDLASKYDAATVQDLYELVGVSSNYTDAKWGWTDFRDSGITRVRSGYLLNLPSPEPLD